MKLGAGAGLIACDKCSHHRDRAHFKIRRQSNIMNKHKRHFLNKMASTSCLASSDYKHSAILDSKLCESLFVGLYSLRTTQGRLATG